MIRRLGNNPKLLVMNQHLLKTVVLYFLLSQVNASYSQKNRGKYLTVNTPADAPNRPLSADGVLEFPVKITKANIKLKSFHRFEWIEMNLDGSNPKVSKGKWKASDKTIKLTFQSSDSLISRYFEIVKLKSGTYIKRVNDYFHYYKKQ